MNVPVKLVKVGSWGSVRAVGQHIFVHIRAGAVCAGPAPAADQGGGLIAGELGDCCSAEAFALQLVWCLRCLLLSRPVRLCAVLRAKPCPSYLAVCVLALWDYWWFWSCAAAVKCQREPEDEGAILRRLRWNQDSFLLECSWRTMMAVQQDFWVLIRLYLFPVSESIGEEGSKVNGDHTLE